jgi:integrase/recombinase XerC
VVTLPNQHYLSITVMPRRSPRVPSSPPSDASSRSQGTQPVALAKKSARPKAKARSTVLEPEIVEPEIEPEIVEPEIVEPEIVEPENSTSLATRAPASSLDGARSAFATWLGDKHESTMRRYQGDLGDFAAWRMGRPDDGLGLSVSEADIVIALRCFMDLDQGASIETGLRYRTWLKKRGLASNSINRKLSALRSYVKLANQVGACPWVMSITGIEVELVRDVRGPGPDGYLDLITAAEAFVSEAKEASNKRSHACWVRNIALLRLYHDAGLRRREPLTIDFPVDVDLSRNPRLRALRKKRREKAWIDIGSDRAVAALKDWIALRGDDPGPLFTSMHRGHMGKRLQPGSINEMFAVLSERAGIEVTPHGLRHTAATSLLNKTGGDVRAVAGFLGHKGTAMVEHYDDERQQQARKMGSLFNDD